MATAEGAGLEEVGREEASRVEAVAEWTAREEPLVRLLATGVEGYGAE